MVNYRGKLQELCQKKGVELPKYEAINTASDHEPVWLSTCTALGLTAEGTGTSIKTANSNAAEILLQNFSDDTIYIKKRDDIPEPTTKNHIVHLISGVAADGSEFTYIDPKFLNIQNCLEHLWSQGDTIKWYNFSTQNLSNDVIIKTEYIYTGKWYTTYINDFELLFWCPDGTTPTKESGIIIG